MWHRDPQTVLVTPDDATFWRTIWKSDEFRTAANDPKNPYHQVVAWAKKKPWWFVPERLPQERAHFGAWFGNVIGQREYENPLIHDLYILHEILHAVTFIDNPRDSEAGWRHRMRANEIAVSLETEVLVYARHPDWRKKTFDHPIWADRFDLSQTLSREMGAAVLTRESIERQLWQKRPQGQQWPLAFMATQSFPSMASLWYQRRKAARSPQDGIEQGISHYEGEAEAFFRAWQPFWRHIEIERRHFDRLCREGRWQEAVARREKCWETYADTQGIPYGQVVACETR